MSSTDPSIHQSAERQMLAHVQRLLDDPRFMIDTTLGRRAVAPAMKKIVPNDRAVELKRLMSEMNLPDRELQERMPIGSSLEVTLARKRWWFITKTTGQIKVICVSPTRTLLAGQAPAPMSAEEVSRVIRETPPPIANVPGTLVVVSTSGFTMDAREKVERSTTRTVILAQPNDAGGWSIYGPPETKALNDLLDPEADNDKRSRVREALGSSQLDLINSGIAADRLAAKTQLPIGFVESELKSFAREQGLTAKRIDGRVVLYREGSGSVMPAAGGSVMPSINPINPIVDRIKAIFSRKGETEKKIAFLSERRAALSQQRDRGYDDIAVLEKKDADLKAEFADASSMHAKKRVTGQLLQLRKDIERRQQMLGVVNQQLNVISTHLHNLELVQQGTTAKLPDSEEIVADASAAEEMLAELQANTEEVERVGGIASVSMSDEEQALFEELERETGGEPPEASNTEPSRVEPVQSAQRTNVPPIRQPSAQPPRKEAEPG